MTDEEFDVLDELYFVTSFEQLERDTGLARQQLIGVLKSIHEKGWIKVMETIDEEVSGEQMDMDHRAHEYFFLATKSGLLAHNS